MDLSPATPRTSCWSSGRTTSAALDDRPAVHRPPGRSAAVSIRPGSTCSPRLPGVVTGLDSPIDFIDARLELDGHEEDRRARRSNGWIPAGSTRRGHGRAAGSRGDRGALDRPHRGRARASCRARRSPGSASWPAASWPSARPPIGHRTCCSPGRCGDRRGGRPRGVVRRQPAAVGCLDRGPRRRRLLRPRAVQGRRRPAAAVRDRDGRRRRRSLAAPSPVPFRDRHAVMGAAGGAGHRRRLLAGRGRARPVARGRARVPRRALRRSRTCTTCRTSLDGEFDVVYTSRGVLGWLPDIAGWARVVAHFLAPGGTFFITEAHPVIRRFEDEGVAPGELRLRYPYWEHREPLVVRGQGLLRRSGRGRRRADRARLGSRAGRDRDRADRRRPADREARRAPVPRLEGRLPGRGRRSGLWRLPADSEGELPLMFSLRATKPA